MLPILGKNKTSVLHSVGQFNVESIVNQKKCVNKPRKELFENTNFTTTSDKLQTTQITQQKLSKVIKQKEKELAAGAKEDEKFLLKQIGKVAELMAKEENVKDHKTYLKGPYAPKVLSIQQSQQATPLGIETPNMIID